MDRVPGRDVPSLRLTRSDRATPLSVDTKARTDEAAAAWAKTRHVLEACERVDRDAFRWLYLCPLISEAADPRRLELSAGVSLGD